MDSFFSDFEQLDFNNPSSQYHEYQPQQTYAPMKLGLMKQSSFVDFEQQSTIQQNKQGEIFDIFQDNTGTVNNIQKKGIQKTKTKKQQNQSRDYKKNICRNILRHAVKSMINCTICSEYIEQLVSEPQQFKIHYNRILEQITGFRVLKNYLLNVKGENLYESNMKLAFQKYLIWYLRNRATQMILLGDTLNPKEYIQYKNEVLLYYIQRPEEWNSNKADWKEKTLEQEELLCWDQLMSPYS